MTSHQLSVEVDIIKHKNLFSPQTQKGFLLYIPKKDISELEKEKKMSFSNPQNDINPEMANGCGSLALEDIWLFLLTTREKEFSP
ncbi:CLUMA_CG011117, isoform A [Clunio marinus]|uniref:CLUMA_CG011117, isoform A n=1 Tax=Clunio marinus TaxID=568069 RepID=A0A1J1IH25_9DIPT|nr:CLUMA_CG011117, isoform A [Clunio marinus]